nr:solute carrier family 41 [Cryptococcus depauperatus CBS 7841]
MSPILKRDVAEQLHQVKRLAAAAAGSPYREEEYRDSPYEQQSHNHSCQANRHGEGKLNGGLTYTSSSSFRQGIGVDRAEIEADHDSREADWLSTKASSENSKNKGKFKIFQADYEEVAVEDDNVDEFLEDRSLSENCQRREVSQATFAYVEPSLTGTSPSTRGTHKMRDLARLLAEATPSLMLSLIGLVFTGELLEHLARWRVFQRVDELFILIPMTGNLKGNLEMCLSARLGTSANIGELDHRLTRRAMLVANMTLLGLQSLIISCIAAFISFGLGLVTIHRLGDAPDNIYHGNSTSSELEPGLSSANQEWHEGYTRPGWKQLVMVLATGMGAAGISSAVLGSFMGNLIVISRWTGADPDNITPPLAACLGDLLTLFILALLGTALVGTMDTVIPLLAVIIMSVSAGWFTKSVMRNRWVKEVAKGGWIPLIGAMLISSGTGMVLSKGVEKYRGFALLAISMTGLTGSIGAIHANRLSTQLHTLLHPHPQLRTITHSFSPHLCLTPLQSSLTLFVISFLCQGAFLLFVNWAGWIDLSLGWTGWVAFALTTILSLSAAHYMTLFFWSKDLDPESVMQYANVGLATNEENIQFLYTAYPFSNGRFLWATLAHAGI